MKKILITLIALVAIVATADAQTVYVSTGDGAVAYHKSKSCSYLANSKDVKSVSATEAKKMGRHECQRCYGTAAASKKATTTAKKATTTAKKTTTAARDEKGRFVKKADAEKKTVEKKAENATKKAEKATKKATTPARDEKGRFIKKADTQKKTKKAA